MTLSQSATGSQVSLTDLAKAGLPFQMPWTRQDIVLGTGLDSALLQTENPWKEISPFNLGSDQEKWLSYDNKADSRASFREAESDSHLSTTNHYSGSLGATIGCPFLSANVTGTYDQTVIHNVDVSCSHSTF